MKSVVSASRHALVWLLVWTQVETCTHMDCTSPVMGDGFIFVARGGGGQAEEQEEGLLITHFAIRANLKHRASSCDVRCQHTSCRFHIHVIAVFLKRGRNALVNLCSLMMDSFAAVRVVTYPILFNRKWPLQPSIAHHTFTPTLNAGFSHVC